MPPFPTSALRSPLPIDYGPEDEDEHGHLRLKPSSVLCNRCMYLFFEKLNLKLDIYSWVEVKVVNIGFVYNRQSLDPDQ